MRKMLNSWRVPSLWLSWITAMVIVFVVGVSTLVLVSPSQAIEVYPESLTSVSESVDTSLTDKLMTPAEAWYESEKQGQVEAAAPVENYVAVSGPGSAISESEMLSYIITKESHGDPYATNGKYKGIGQLQDGHYLAYVGMDYASTLQTASPYEVQQQAMLGYIGSRYGSVESAYYFWVGHGWY